MLFFDFQLKCEEQCEIRLEVEKAVMWDVADGKELGSNKACTWPYKTVFNHFENSWGTLAIQQ